MKLLLALVGAAPLLAQCTYTVSPTQFNIAAGSGNGSVTGPTVNVTSQTGCSWGATTNTPWLHIDFGQTGSGSGSVGWHADTNTVAASRTGLLSVAGQGISVTQAAQTCTYTLTPQAPSTSFPAGGGSDKFQVQTGCTWAPSPGVNWITLPQGGGSVTGNATVNYTVAANGCVSGRSGSIAIAASVQFPINQDGSPNNFSFSPASESYSPAATDDRVTVTTGAGCGWSVFSDVSWLTVTSGSSGSGNGSFSIHVVANTSAARTGNLHINNSAAVMLLPVTQAAALPPAPQISQILNAADYGLGAVSPGEIVSLFGSNLGPSPAALLQVAAGGQSITKTLGGVQVLFDNVPAAMTYASATQVNAVVPYGVAGNAQTNVQVVYQGNSNTVTLPVQPSAPAIFTLDASGLGPGAILNQDLSVNGPANRAARGSVVAIYCTGGGITNPPSADAAIISGTPPTLLSLPVAVTIGNQNAAVQYAGAAPGNVAGLTQINVVVPSNLSPANNVPVVVTVGGASSPNGVTLAVQ